MRKKIEDFSDRPLYYRQLCKNGHHDGSGQSIKLMGRNCLACDLGYPPGEFTTSVTDINPRTHKGNKKYFTEEERKKARSENSMRWTAKNMDKHKEYVSRYYAKLKQERDNGNNK